jgi:hypothetical protein
MQAIVKLPLKFPFKLRVVEIAWMKFEVIGMHRNWRIFEIYEYFHTVAFRVRGKLQQRVFVELQLRKDAFEPGIGCIGHAMILSGVPLCA